MEYPQDETPGLLTPNRQAMLGAASGLLQASGWSPTPVSLGNILGKGIEGGLSNYRAAIKNAAELASAQQKGQNSSDILEYEYAKRQGYAGSFPDWMAAKRGGAGEHGLTPVWGRDANGNVVPIQLGKSGQAIASKLPEGLTIQGKEAVKLDAGTHWILLDPLTRQQIAIIPKDVRGKEREEEIGKGEGVATVALPAAIANGEQMLKQIEEVQNHPARTMATGPIMGRLPGLAGKQLDFVERADQLKGQAFLQAYQQLRGGGAITEVEGLKGEVAIARLSRAKNWGDYNTALEDLKVIVKRGVENARIKAGKPTNPADGGSMVGAPGTRIIPPTEIPPPPEGYTVVH